MSGITTAFSLVLQQNISAKTSKWTKILNVVLMEDPEVAPWAQISVILARHKLKMQKNNASMSLTISVWRYSNMIVVMLSLGLVRETKS